MPVIGTQQSPLAIASAAAIYAPFGNTYLRFLYGRPLTGHINHENFVFDPPVPGDNPDDWAIEVGGVRWLIRQIHMHAPAEHLVDTATAKPFEVHLVHSAPDDVPAAGNKLVVGVFITAGAETRAKKSLEKFADRLTKRQAAKNAGSEPSEVNPHDFLPDAALTDFYRYEGSLTGPPFSEDVSWFVMKEDGVVEQAKFDALAGHAEHTARSVQPLNRRFVLKSFQ